MTSDVQHSPSAASTQSMARNTIILMVAFATAKAISLVEVANQWSRWGCGESIVALWVVK